MRTRFRNKRRTWPLIAIVFIVLMFSVLRAKLLLQADTPGGAAEREANPKYLSTDTLIIVPGHGVLNAPNASEWKNESEWCLEPHQLRAGVVLPLCFASHIRRGLEILRDQINTSILIFSGGQTCGIAGPRSEALGYYIVAKESKLFGIFEPEYVAKDIMNGRIFTEEFARDSYENLLFSIARFYEVTGHFPGSVVVVGWKHKAERFTMYHREAIRFPADKFTYVGLDFADAEPFVEDLQPYQVAKPYTDENALSSVSKDMYLCDAGRRTRSKRNPYFRVPPYLVSCPPLRQLLQHCGPELIDTRRVPWK
ncbi:uncharacterized protein TEOVI_000392200 [Trypanosoma equiperdum]|uniref:Uncharacterized protein n=1 Tax=Trypanosoma equiperdum TaxID=5694 RepID=A0A1G4IIM1_TRYEQ|nr:hypothetical protein, conserved [Trypanosoma equiperdum]